MDSVLESTRAKEAAVRKETVEQIEAFRRAREEADKEAGEAGGGVEGAGSPTEEKLSWGGGRKRKRNKDKDKDKGDDKEARQGNGAKFRRKSETTEVEAEAEGEGGAKEQGKDTPKESLITGPSKVVQEVAVSPTSTSESPKEPVKIANLGLAGYSSEDED